MTDVPAALNAAFPPSADLLLDLARRQIDDIMLREIAEADYGYMATEMLAELRPIRDQGIIPAPMHGQLGEVLTLTRFRDPEAPNLPPSKHGRTGRRGHQIRLFACAVLLRATAERVNRYIDASDDSTLANCLISAQVLGPEVSVAAARFLTWRIDHPVSFSEPLLFALALLILATRLRSGRFPDAVLGNAAEWVLAEEARWIAVEARWRPASAPHDLSDTIAAFSLQSGFWKPLAAELLREAATIQADDVRSNLQLCELLLET